MPIYMDRHNVSDAVTAEIVAHLHQEDLKIQHLFGCRGLTYWFDDKRKTAFCLIEAPNMKTLQKMHDRAHGNVPNSIIEVEPRIVESFLGRIGDPEQARNTELNIINDPAFRTLMVVSLIRLTPVSKNNLRSRLAFANFRKQITKTAAAGDSAIVKQSEAYGLFSFRSVTNAVQAAVDIYALYRQFSSRKTNHRILFKIALNAGVPVTDRPSIFEDTIRGAERMCAAARSGITVSCEVKDLYKSENAGRFIGGQHILALSRADEEFISLLMNCTEAEWNNPNFGAADLVRPTGCSRSRLYRKMISLTGQSPNAFIREYRLQAALKLFRNGSRNISETAFETGFGSPSYFSNCFRKRFGHQPSEYLDAP